MKRHSLPLILAAGLLAVPACAADLLGGGGWGLISPPGAAVLQTKGPVLHVTVRRPMKAYYQIELSHDVTAALPAKAAVRYHFLARSPGKNTIHAVIEKRTAPYTHYADKMITLTPAWKDYTVTARLPAAFGPRGLAARLQVGQQAGVVEFKGVSVTKG